MKITISRAKWTEIGEKAGWIKEASNYCGGFKPAKKGKHLDTQMYPECKNTETDRNIVTKTVKNRNKKKKKKN